MSEPQDFWIHAVSVGEVNVAKKLIAALRERDPGLRITLSTTTSTGFAVAEGASGGVVTVIYNPLDLPGVVELAFDAIRPRHIVLVEAEIWPNLVARAHRDQELGCSCRTGTVVPVGIHAPATPDQAQRYQDEQCAFGDSQHGLDLLFAEFH